MSDFPTIRTLLDSGADGAPAMVGAQRSPLTFRALRKLVDEVGGTLSELGIGRQSRVAIVLPNGPEMAACFTAVACHATAAPLNPACRQEEFEFYLSDLGARALIVAGEGRARARPAATRLGLQVIELVTRPALPAGTFQLRPSSGTESSAAQSARPAEPDDIALMLHTSGTTSRPKVVPLSHRNLCASARNVAATLRLDTGDVCLNVMPLFHIHGLVAALLASLGAGGSVFAAPGFDALRFFVWLQEAEATWYSAVPAMHQAILRRAARNRAIIGSNPLRFIRSASASLPRQVLAELESTFGVAVIEAYAMTEAAHQMTSNPLPPGERIPGSVGRAAGPEVAVMHETATTLLDPGQTGEVVIRGDNVFAGYENNAEANAAAFADGWFRTGDQAVMDGQGYLTITGRLKEIINRGGEKISPLEVDDVLMDHPAVLQAVTFAMPHEALGEEVAAAVVLREHGSAGQHDIRRFAAERLAPFKVPRRVVVVDEIPKGATGKLQRIGLATRLGLA